jgi:hypothetical protein
MALGQPDVEQRLGGVAGRRRNSGVAVVHAGGESGAVVEKMELASEADRIGGRRPAQRDR